MTELIVAGEGFNVLVEGEESAPVLMLSNSLGTNLHMWDKQIAAFKRHFRVVRYDSRGHGGSVVSEGPYTIEQLGRDALGIMDALGFEKVHWLGLSKGGMIGQWLLVHAPERIDRAVLANTAAQIGAPDIWNERIRVAEEEGMSALAPQVIERWFTRGFREAHPEEVERIKVMLEETSPEGYAACCAAIRDMDQRDELSSISHPVLVIVGHDDPATPPGMGGLIASSIAGAKLISLDAAHLSNIEATEDFNRAVIGFLTAGARLAASEPEETTADEPKSEEPAAVEGPTAAPAKKPRRKPAASRKPAKEPVGDMPEPPGIPDAPSQPEPEAEDEEALPTELMSESEEGESEAAPLAPAPASPRPAPRRRPVKKAATKKSAAGKPAGRRTAPRTAAKKASAGRAAAKKAATKKSPARKSPAKAAAKKSTARTAVSKKTAAKRGGAARKVTKKAAVKKSAVKKASVKKSAVKKVSTKKAGLKKAAAKKSSRRSLPSRTSGRKTRAVRKR